MDCVSGLRRIHINLSVEGQTRSLSENALSESELTCPNSSLFRENNARNINDMTVRVFFGNASICDEIAILGQPPSIKCG